MKLKTICREKTQKAREKIVQKMNGNKKQILFAGPPLYICDLSTNYIQAISTNTKALTKLVEGSIPEIFTEKDKLKQELAQDIRAISNVKRPKPARLHSLSNLATMYMVTTKPFDEWYVCRADGSGFIVVLQGQASSENISIVRIPHAEDTALSADKLIEYASFTVGHQEPSLPMAASE